MKLKYKIATAVLGLFGCISLSSAQANIENYSSIKDTYLDKNSKDTNYGNSSQLLVTKNGKGNTLLSFDLDNTLNFPTNDCNLTADIEKAELVLDIISTADCDGGCTLEVRNSIDFTEGDGATGSGSTWHCETDTDVSNNNPDCAEDKKWQGGNIGSLVAQSSELTEGFSGELRIDVTDFVKSLDSGSLKPNIALTANGKGDIILSSKEGTTAPRVEITPAVLEDNESDIPEISRNYIDVNGINTSYLEAGDPNSPNQFLLIHGIPSYSYMFRNVLPKLAEHGHVVAYDWVGTGFTDKAPLADFDYRFDTQANQLADFVDAIGLTTGGRQLIMVIHEVGGLGAFHYATTHQADIKGIAFMETWIDLCPPGQEGIACSKDSLVFTPDLLGAWEYVVYPDTSLQYPGTHPWTGACGLIRNYATPAALRYGMTVRGISDQVILNYEEPFGCQYDLNNPTDASCPNDPICDLDFSIAHFPKNIPVQVPGEPAYARNLYDTYVSVMKSWSVPKLLAYGDPGAVVNNIGMVFHGQSEYPNLTASCVGKAGHFTPEDAPINLARRVIEWAMLENLLD